jgi:hypothetical protein
MNVKLAHLWIAAKDEHIRLHCDARRARTSCNANSDDG